jgi:transcriptional regulator with XRE-family HTH domain
MAGPAKAIGRPEEASISAGDLQLRIGHRVRQRRAELGLKLRDLAERTGFTASFLSLLERGLTNPSVEALRKVAEALGVPVFYFLMEDAPSRRVVRSDQRMRLTFPGSKLTYELLVPDLNRKMEIFVGRLSPTGENIAVPPAHMSEECIIVTQGRMAITIGDETYILDAGDSVYFSGPELREIRAIGSDELVWISAITPPIF